MERKTVLGTHQTSSFSRSHAKGRFYLLPNKTFTINTVMYINYSKIPLHFNIASFIYTLYIVYFGLVGSSRSLTNVWGFHLEDSAVLGCFVFTNNHDFFTTSKKETLRYVVGFAAVVPMTS